MRRRDLTRYAIAAATVPLASAGFLVLYVRQKPRSRSEAAGVAVVQRADPTDLAARLRRFEIDPAAFREAARNLCPVESELEAAEIEVTNGRSLSEVTRELRDRWTKSRFLDPSSYLREAEFTGRKANEGQHLSLGVRVAPAVEQGISLDEAALAALQSQGAVVLRGAVQEGDLVRLRSLISLDPYAARWGSKVMGERLLEEFSDVVPRRLTGGRLHFFIRGTRLGEQLELLHAAWLPLVHAAIPTRGLRRPYVSEMALVYQDPLAKAQSWHRDTVSPGISVIVPLNDLSEEGGQQEVLRGTHIEALPAEVRCGGPAEAVGVWRAGDALVFDSRLLHRASANETFRTSAILWFRYDLEGSDATRENSRSFLGLMRNSLNALQGGALSVACSAAEPT